jgi:4-amino-4-deoxy-L-arabinose transferase-like glycosyltransferase
MEMAQDEHREPGRIVSFLERRSLLLACVFIAVAVVRIVSAYTLNGITYDEPAHIACGMQYLAQHVYRYEAQHPPLARAMCALGPYLAGAHPAGQDYMTPEGIAILYEDGQVARNVVLDRLGILPFFVLACLVVYFWGKLHFGGAVGVLATCLFTLTPVILAHAGLGTTDMALTACFGASFLTMLLWVQRPTTKSGLLFGVATGLALLSKFSVLVFLPSSAAAAFLFYLMAERPGLRNLGVLARERAASLGVAVFTACVLLHAGYLFSFGEVPGWGVWLPAPEFFQGIREVIEHNEWGHPAFFLGHLSRTGWWYYFPVMLLFKTPTAMLLLAAVGSFVCWKSRMALKYALPAAVIAGVLLPSMAGRIDIGTRHILPVYFGLSLLGGLALRFLLLRWHWAGALICAAMVVELAIAGGLHHPNYLSYTNEFVRRPENLFADSDLDWGQGTPLLAKRLRELRTKDVTCSFWYLTADELRTWPGLAVHELDFGQPAEGWTAVSVTYWRLIGYVTNQPNVRDAWFANREPIERLGGLLLYYVPPGGATKK